MGHLLLAIACSAAIALIFKHSETSGRNRYAVTTANYLAACLVGIWLVARTPQMLPDVAEPLRDLALLARVLRGEAEQMTPAAGSLWALMVGGGAGAFFFAAFIFYQISVRRYGVGLSGAFAKLGILVPLALSLLFWREYPTSLQWVGMVLAVISILWVNLPTRVGPSRPPLGETLRPALLLLFLFGGLAEFSNKIFQKYGLLDAKALFLLATFATAFLCSLVATLRKGRDVCWRDVWTGIAVGVPNIFSSFFLISALDRIPAAVVFPSYGAGTIVIISLVGATFFRERLSRREWAVIGLTVVALVIINL